MVLWALPRLNHYISSMSLALVCGTGIAIFPFNRHQLPDERHKIMKRFLILAVFALGLALPAHAQFGGQSIGSGSLSSGGGINAGAPRLASEPPAQFAMTGVSGNEAEFTPSAFLAYDQAIAAGKESLAAKEKSVAKVASENSTVQKPRAKFAMVQDCNGNPIIVSR
jgi:hypothetical protein